MFTCQSELSLQSFGVVNLRGVVAARARYFRSRQVEADVQDFVAVAFECCQAFFWLAQIPQFARAVDARSDDLCAHVIKLASRKFFGVFVQVTNQVAVVTVPNLKIL